MNKRIFLYTLLAITLLPTRAQEPAPWGRIVESRCVIASGQGGADCWRIPAIAALHDSTLLITIDRRKHNCGDLPQDIDILALRSADLGRTWDTAVIALGQGIGRGFGDAALALSESGTVICSYVGGNGLWDSDIEKPQRSFVTLSRDEGKSWSDPQDITHLLWNSGSSQSEYRGSFFASGNGLRIKHGEHKGRILFAAAMRRRDRWSLDNYVVYSDDEGASWRLSDLAYRGGDEAKLAELSDGTLLISVRQEGERGYNRSIDGGQSWGTQGKWPDLVSNACNGDILGLQGSNGLTLIHSLPNSLDRENVSLFLSRDEGRSWHSPLLLSPGPSAYSSLTLLPDGRIAALVERMDGPRFEIWLYIIALTDAF